MTKQQYYGGKLPKTPTMHYAQELVDYALKQQQEKQTRCKMTLNKPGRKVYVIYDDTISLKSAEYIGQHSFIVAGYEWLTSSAREWDYEDYGKTWFTSFEKAKKFLIQDNLDQGITGKIIRLAIDYWEFKPDEVKE